LAESQKLVVLEAHPKSNMINNLHDVGTSNGTYFFLWIRSNRQPLCAKSLTMQRLGGLLTIAMS